MVKKLTSEEFTNYCKKKGFVYRSSDIYGGLSGVYDYGHVGTLLKNNWSDLWKKFFLRLDDNFVEIDASTIMHENVFKASGHLENFFDPITECTKCDDSQRADKFVEDSTGIRTEGLGCDELLKLIRDNKLKCPNCSSEFKSVEKLNMMFPVEMGPKKGTRAYLRPETAQSPFVNFKGQFEIQRKKIPMGLAMIGRVYRNEISPRNMLLRTREVEQAELQIFFNPSKLDEHSDFDLVKDYKLRVVLKNDRDFEVKEISCDELVKYGLPKFYVYHMAKVQQFYFDVLNVDSELFRLYELTDDERAFYNKNHFDIEFKMVNPDQWIEIGGVHYRTDHDLSGHERISGEKMEVLDEVSGEKFIPHVLELSFGVGRNIYTILDSMLVDENDSRGNLVLNIGERLAPYKVAIFPLMNKDELVKVAREIYEDLQDCDVSSVYDRSGSVGKRYARQDEIGTPYCVTIDYESIEDGELKGTVTIRDRNSTEQKRITMDGLSGVIISLVRGDLKFDDL